MEWEFIPATNLCAPLHLGGDYVISERNNDCILSYRPPNQHIPCGRFPTVEEAKKFAESHNKELKNK